MPSYLKGDDRQNVNSDNNFKYSTVNSDAKLQQFIDRKGEKSSSSKLSRFVPKYPGFRGSKNLHSWTSLDPPSPRSRMGK